MEAEHRQIRLRHHLTLVGGMDRARAAHGGGWLSQATPAEEKEPRRHGWQGSTGKVSGVALKAEVARKGAKAPSEAVVTGEGVATREERERRKGREKREGK